MKTLKEVTFKLILAVIGLGVIITLVNIAPSYIEKRLSSEPTRSSVTVQKD